MNLKYSIGRREALLLLLLVFSFITNNVYFAEAADSSESEWLAADISFEQHSRQETIVPVHLSNNGAVALDRQSRNFAFANAASDALVSTPRALSPNTANRNSEENSTRSFGLNSQLNPTGKNAALTVLCQFPDVALPTNDLTYFERLHNELNAYWAELSYGKFSMGEANVTQWQQLPQPLSHYKQLPITDALNQIFDGCVQTVASTVSFADIDMINIMLSDSIGSSWAGHRLATLDGASKLWPVTWNMEWSWNSEGRGGMKHEMGHLLGLPHSADTNDNVYYNEWDIMSSAWSQHTVAPHKHMLGWFESEEVVTVNPGNEQTIYLSPLASSDHTRPKMVKIPVLGFETDYLTVEYRTIAGYDNLLPGVSMVVHDVDMERELLNRFTNSVDFVPVKLAQHTSASAQDSSRLWTHRELFVSETGVEIEMIVQKGDALIVRVKNPGHSIMLPLVSNRGTATVTNPITTPTVEIVEPPVESGGEEEQPVIDVIVANPGSLSGHIWNDFDHNGTYDAHETPIADLEVALLLPIGTQRVAVTNEDGAYQFDNLAAGEYVITVAEPISGKSVWSYRPNGDSAELCACEASLPITIVENEHAENINFGFAAGITAVSMNNMAATTNNTTAATILATLFTMLLLTWYVTTYNPSSE